MNKDKGFEWSGWIMPVNRIKTPMSCWGFNKDGTMSHWHSDAEGKEIDCNCKEETGNPQGDV